MASVASPQLHAYRELTVQQFVAKNKKKQVKPWVGRPTVMLTVNKQTVMNKDVTICNTKVKVDS